MMRKIYLSFGGNIGNTERIILKALQFFQRHSGCFLLNLSCPYKTPPWGKLDQESFINACAIFETRLNPIQFLNLSQFIELKLQRKRIEKWGPRTIDVDLLFMESIGDYNTYRLILPHPYLIERAFVLSPLNEIASHLIVKGQKIKIWHKIKKDDRIVKLKPTYAWKKVQNSVLGRLSSTVM